MKTSDQIIEAGKAALINRGYAGTGLKDVLGAARVPKGSFYHFFASKEAFAASVMESYDRQFDDFFVDCFENPDLSPREQLRRFFFGSIERLEGEKFQTGCLIGAIGMEASVTSTALRQTASKVMSRWESLIADCLTRAEHSGELRPGVSPEELAQFILNGWEGAMLRMRIEQSAEPLSNFANLVFDGFFVAPNSEGQGRTDD